MKKYLPAVLLLAIIFITACGRSTQPEYEAPVQPVRELTPYVPTPTQPLIPVAQPPTFPVIEIATDTHPFHMPRTTWHDGTVVIDGWESHARVRGRGNTTWIYGEEKRPLRLRFTQPTYLLDFPTPHRDWILLANHFDRSLLRNHGAMHLAGQLHGMYFTPRSQFVNLYINGNYYGIYELTDERNQDLGRANLRQNIDPTLSEFFIELNGHARYFPPDEQAEVAFVVNDMYYEMRWPSGPYHLAYANQYISAVSQAIRSGNITALNQLIDIPSFIDFYIVQELFKNGDIGGFSVFMQIRGQGMNRRLHMGPVWDFDQSSGNTSLVENPLNPIAARDNYWFRYLMEIPQFKQAVNWRWEEIRNNQLPQTINHLQDIATQYQDNFNRNFYAFPYIMGDLFEWNWVQSYATAALPTFQAQVDFLIDYLETRAMWMDHYLTQRLPDLDTRMALQQSLAGHLASWLPLFF